MSELSALRRKFGVGNNPCLQHLAMLKKRHWNFCPHCGEKLQIRLHCDDCGMDFMSEKAFQLHRGAEWPRMKKITAKHREKTGADHRIVYMKRQDKFFCSDCQKILEE